MTDKQNPWDGPDGRKAIDIIPLEWFEGGVKVRMIREGNLWRKQWLTDSGKWVNSALYESHEAYCILRDEARVFMRKNWIAFGHNPTAIGPNAWFRLHGQAERFFTNSDERDIAAVLAVGKEKP